MENEYRNYALTEVEVRQGENADELPTISGYASVFNSETTIAGVFREVVRKGAFKRAIKENQDVRALIDHASSLILGRTKAGTLTLVEDDKGLRTIIKPPNTQVARDLVENLRVGNVDQMSFGFIVKKQQWSSNSEVNGLDLREILDVDLFDVSVVTYPAYDSTTVGLRGSDPKNIYEVAKRELEEARGAKTEPLRLKLELALL
jgi:HK97 family phage prohead protease